MGYERRADTPKPVERQLRQEAGFGCVRCGHPYIEYHHIVPYSEVPVFKPEDMMCVCGNCHPAVGKMGADRQREFKAKPHNVAKGVMRGALDFDKKELAFKVGGNHYIDVPTMLQYRDIPIVSCRLSDGQAMVSLNLLGQDNKTVLRVDDNDVTFRVDDLWDFEYKHNYVVARYAHRDVAMTLDFRGAEATIEGKIWFGGNQATLGRDATTLPGLIAGGNIQRGGRIGIHIR
jgi:hypothetical protein